MLGLGQPLLHILSLCFVAPSQGKGRERGDEGDAAREDLAAPSLEPGVDGTLVSVRNVSSRNRSYARGQRPRAKPQQVLQACEDLKVWREQRADYRQRWLLRHESTTEEQQPSAMRAGQEEEEAAAAAAAAPSADEDDAASAEEAALMAELRALQGKREALQVCAALGPLSSSSVASSLPSSAAASRRLELGRAAASSRRGPEVCDACDDGDDGCCCTFGEDARGPSVSSLSFAPHHTATAALLVGPLARTRAAH